MSGARNASRAFLRSNALTGERSGCSASGTPTGPPAGPLFGACYDLSGNGGDGLGNQSGTVLNGRANLNWSPTDADLFQLNAISSGRYIAPQGSVAPRYALNLGYRRKLGDGQPLQRPGRHSQPQLYLWRRTGAQEGRTRP
jgi:hypothetical protein